MRPGLSLKRVRRVNRDVKAVHGDVTALISAGVLDRAEGGGIVFLYEGRQGGAFASGGIGIGRCAVPEGRHAGAPARAGHRGAGCGLARSPGFSTLNAGKAAEWRPDHAHGS